MKGKDLRSKRSTDGRPAQEVNLRHLPPSHELLEHYRSRLKKINSEYEALSETVRDCFGICNNVSKLQQEVLHKDSEMSQLQQAISDLQVYVYQERQQVLNLYAENDRLKINNAELLRRNEILHSIADVTEEEIALFVKPSGSLLKAVPRRNVKTKSSKSRVTSDSNFVDTDEVDLLHLRVQALQAQLTEQSRLHEDENTALRQDRELQRAEHLAERQKQQQTIEELAAQLSSAREQVCKLTSELLQAKQEHRGVEANWLSEREKLLKLTQEQPGQFYPDKNLVLPGGGSKNCGVVGVLREQLAERERLLATYQEQCVAMEAQVTRLHEQTESSRALFKDKVQKMASQVTYLRNKYAELDRRRLTEAEGFRTDIRLMRTRLRELERGFNKFGAPPGGTISGSRNSETSSNACLALTARDTMHRARQLEAELKNIRNKVISLESELQLEKDK